jgi:CPA2 family monovalent cation:H+ antiporter-2
VIICGYGRSGQYLGRFLKEENIPFMALDIDPARVLEAAAAGENVMFGDAGRRVVLEAAGGARAKALIISYSDTPAAMKILHVVQETYPQLPVIVRTVDDSNMESLREAGAAEVVPEILEGSLMLASHALMLLGVPLHRVIKRIRLFREERYKLFKGYFHGISDAENLDVEKQQVRLHSVIISAGAFAVGRPLSEMQLENFAVEVKSIRRPNGSGVQPTDDTPLAEGDVIVLLGQPTGLINAQNAILIGRIASK